MGRDQTSGELVFGGTPPDDQGLATGSFWLPALIDGVDPSSAIAQEEVFGPVLVTMPFTDDEEAVALANATDHGLLAAVWTTDLSRAHRVGLTCASSVRRRRDLPPGWEVAELTRLVD